VSAGLILAEQFLNESLRIRQTLGTDTTRVDLALASVRNAERMLAERDERIGQLEVKAEVDASTIKYWKAVAEVARDRRDAAEKRAAEAERNSPTENDRRIAAKLRALEKLLKQAADSNSKMVDSLLSMHAEIHRGS
jgi:hypothetical protein